MKHLAVFLLLASINAHALDCRKPFTSMQTVLCELETIKREVRELRDTRDRDKREVVEYEDCHVKCDVTDPWPKYFEGSDNNVNYLKARDLSERCRARCNKIKPPGVGYEC